MGTCSGNGVRAWVEDRRFERGMGLLLKVGNGGGGVGKSDFNEGLFNVHVKQIIGNKDCLCIQRLNYLG